MPRPSSTPRSRISTCSPTPSGRFPRRFFDTQIAGGFVGYGTPSLSSLLNGELSINPPKGDRLTDWLRRPLTDAQRQYAAVDVAHLLELYERLDAKLDELGRHAWVDEACLELAGRPLGPIDPDDAWTKLKDVRGLRPRARAVAQAIAAWRERTATERNIPVRQVLPDLAVLGIAQRQPRNTKELGQARGVDDRFTRGKIAEQLLAAVERGRNAAPPEAIANGDDLERSLRPAVTLISAWVSQVAKQERIDTAMLATRADLVALLAGDPSARLASGWRAELLGEGIRRLLDGDAALTFDRGNGLRLVDVAAPPFERLTYRPRSAAHGGAHVAPQPIEHRDRFGRAAAIRVDRAAGTNRLVEDDSLGDRRLPDRLA